MAENSQVWSPAYLKLVQLGGRQNVRASLDQLNNDVERVVDGPVVVVHVVLDDLHGIDLVLEAISILAQVLLTSHFAFDLVEPLVQVIQVFSGLSELFLHCLLFWRKKKKTKLFIKLCIFMHRKQSKIKVLADKINSLCAYFSQFFPLFFLF